MSKLLNWISDKLSPGSGHPVLIRVFERSGKPAGKLKITGTWLPSGRSFEVSPLVSQGLCLIPWTLGERVLEAEVTAESGVRKVKVRGNRPDPERALELRLQQDND